MTTTAIPTPTPTPTASTAEDYKKLGNKSFALGEHEEAIQHYTEAIKLGGDNGNHVFLSNRSASYANLKRWDEAAVDARECLRLSTLQIQDSPLASSTETKTDDDVPSPSIPSPPPAPRTPFLKGYHRLAVALSGAGNDIGAVKALEEGLSHDPRNAPIGRLLRTVKARIAATKAPSSSTVDTTGSMNGITVPSTSATEGEREEAREIAERLRDSLRDCRIVESEISNREKEKRRCQIAVDELQLADDPSQSTSVSEGAVYRGVGRTFIKESREDVVTYLEKAASDEEKRVGELKLKREYLERRIRSQKQNIAELGGGGE